ncbi:interferon-related developmental regulator-domain-containing protein [Globomyces pollinis-pini]|nr:interferon-related developmental regulator-domain-containing protein [Globomyces pollinis-pini]
MSKRKSKKSLSESMLVDDDSDDGSIHTSSSMGNSSIVMSRSASQRSIVEETIDTQIENCIKDLEDKRSSVREACLIRSIRMLSNRWLKESVLDYVDEWVLILAKTLRRDGVEGSLACQALSLIWITTGDNIGLFESTITSLMDCIKNGTDELKCSATATLGLIAFIESIDGSTCWELLDFLQSNFEERDITSKLMHNTLQSFGLIYSKCEKRHEKEEFNLIMDRHMELLEDNDVDVRIIAGENIALFLEDRYHYVTTNQIQEETPFFERLDELISTLDKLSHDSQKSRAKRDRAIQKSSFRDILNSVQSHMEPTMKLKFKSEVVEFDDWGKIRQLNAFREAVGEGLTIHFHENPIFHTTFDYDDGQTRKNDRGRLFDTIVGKARSKAKKAFREHKTARQMDL